jgi:predicted Zn-dependent protease
MFFGGGALAWAVATWLLWQGQSQIGYRAAIRHLRRNQLTEAIAAMDALIAAEPEQAGHYRFRAGLHRLAGDLDAAERDYQQVMRLSPGSADGCLGLAEVAIQRGEYAEAQEYTQRAARCAADDWRVRYTRALLADRLADAREALESAQAALSAGLADRRMVALLHLWRVRAYARLGDLDSAQAALHDLRASASGLQDWGRVLDSPQAAALRALMADDLRDAQALLKSGAETLLVRWHAETLTSESAQRQEVDRGRRS